MVKNRVRDIAQGKGIGKGKLARMADLTPAVISKLWENPRHNAEVHTMEKIARALGVSFCDLFYEEDDIPPPRGE